MSPRLLAGAAVVLGALAACSSTSSATGCSGTTCSVTLNGTGSSVDVLGQHLSFGGTDGGREMSCTEGQSVDAGPLRLTCSRVTSDSVQLTASLG